MLLSTPNRRKPLGVLSPNVLRLSSTKKGKATTTPRSKVTLKPMIVRRRTPGMGQARRVLTPPPGERSDSEESTLSSVKCENDSDDILSISSKGLLDIDDADMEGSSHFLDISSPSAKSVSRDLSREMEEGCASFACFEAPKATCDDNNVQIEAIRLLRERDRHNTVEDATDGVLLGDVSICDENRELSDIVGKHSRKSEDDDDDDRYVKWSHDELVKKITAVERSKRSLESALVVMERAFDRQGKTLECVRSERIESLRKSANDAREKMMDMDITGNGADVLASGKSRMSIKTLPSSGASSAMSSSIERKRTSRWCRIIEGNPSVESPAKISHEFPSFEISQNESLGDLLGKWRKLEIFYAGKIRKAMDEDISRRMGEWKRKYSTKNM
eukprot:g405.t1